MKSVLMGLVCLAMGVVASSAVAGNFTAYHIGNSLTGDLYYDFRTVATRYQTTQGNSYTWGFHFRPGTSLTYIYNNPTPPSSDPTTSGINQTATSIWPSTNTAPWNSALPNNDWNVLTMEPYPDSDPTVTMGTDTAAVNGMITSAKSLGRNASTRYFIYAAWPAVVANTPGSYSAAYLAATSNTTSQRSILSRDYWKNLTAAVRTTNPGVSVIPVGEVLEILDQKMQGGQFDNFTSVLQLYRDVNHMNSVGQNVVSWTAYATIFKQSPVGLANDYLANSVGSGFSNQQFIDSHDLALMQQTIWDVVNQNGFYTNVPEPASLAILALGGLLLVRRRPS